MLLASVFIKTLMKKVKIIKNCTPILDILFHRLTSNSTLTQMFLPVYINIILTLFLMYNSLVLFTHKKSVQLSSYIYYILSCSKKSFSSEQEEFNVNYSHARVLCSLFICTSTVKKLNQTRAIKIEVLLQKAFRFKVLTEYYIEA